MATGIKIGARGRVRETEQTTQSRPDIRTQPTSSQHDTNSPCYPGGIHISLCDARWMPAKDLAALLNRDAENLQGRILAGMVKKGCLSCVSRMCQTDLIRRIGLFRSHYQKRSCLHIFHMGYSPI